MTWIVDLLLFAFESMKNLLAPLTAGMTQPDGPSSARPGGQLRQRRSRDEQWIRLLIGPSRRPPDAPKAIAAATPETGLPGNEDDDRDEAPEDDDVSEEPQLTDPSEGRDHHARSASIRLPCGVLGPGEPTRRRRGLVRMGLGACSASSVERETLLRAATR